MNAQHTPTPYPAAYNEMLMALRNIQTLVKPGGFHKTRLDERTINLIECQLDRALAKVNAP